MRKLMVPINNQNGSMILIAMMLLVILTVMGITSTNSTITENQIAVNEQIHKMAFYHAESGINTTAQVVELLFENDMDPISDDGFGFVYLIDEDDFEETIRREEDQYEGEAILSFVFQENEDPLVRTALYELSYQDYYGRGSGQMFDAGGSAGDSVVEEEFIFRILSEGVSFRRSRSFISAEFIKVDY